MGRPRTGTLEMRGSTWHTDHRTHMTYVGADPALRQIPAAVVPDVSFGSSTKTPLLVSETPRATQDSNLRPSAPEAGGLIRFAAHRDARFRHGSATMRRATPENVGSDSGTSGSTVTVSDPDLEATRRWLAAVKGMVVKDVSWWETADALTLLGHEGEA